MGREGHCKQTSLACVGSARSVWTTLHLPQLKASCASRVYSTQARGCSAGPLSKAGLEFCALPRAKPLRFSGNLQEDRLGWVCILCPSQFRAAQVTRCLVSVLSRWAMHLNHLLPQPLGFQVHCESTISGVHRRVIQKRSHNPDNHDGVTTHLETDILECEVKWVLGSIATNKASGGDGIPVELFQILKDDAVKVLHSVCQQIWKTQQWPQDWNRSVFIPIPKKCQRMLKLLHNCTHLIC